MIEANTHRWILRVYFEDTDAGGIVYHASYLRFAERGRTEALRELHAPHQQLVDQHGLIFVVRRIKVDYSTPARLDDLLVVATRLGRLRAASLVLHQQIVAADGPLRASRTCASLEVELACVTLAGLKPARVPPLWRTALAGLSDASRE